MGKKKEQIKIVPMSLRQVTTINKIISLYEFKFIKKAISDNKGGYTHFCIKNNEKFNTEDINTIVKHFKKEYNKHLHFEKGEKLGEFFVGNFYLTE
jgi:hypothetical protein